MSHASVRLKHLASSLSLFLLLLSSGTSVLEDDISLCIPANSSLALTGKCECHRDRGLRVCAKTPEVLYDVVCSDLESIPAREGEIYDTVTCLEIRDSSRFKKLDYHQLSLFPNLEGLVVNYTGIEEIADNIADAVPQLRNIYVEHSRLTILPMLGLLPELSFASFAHNNLQTIDQSRFLHTTSWLNRLDLSYNQLTELRGTVFSGLCNLRKLNLAHNSRLREIDNSVFDNTRIQTLDLSSTAISTMPYTEDLGGSLNMLDLRGTTNLHVFHDRGTIVNDQSFAVLREVNFNYHAHCCQLTRSNYSFYELPSISNRRDVASAANGFFQNLYNRFVRGIGSLKSDVSLRRRVRDTIPDETPPTEVCLNYTDLNIVLFLDPPTTTQPATTATPTTPPRDICNCSMYYADRDECEHCIETECNPLPSFDCSVYEAAGVCSQCFRRRRRNAAMEGEGMSNFNNDTLPDGWYFHENLTDLICTLNETVSIVTEVYQPCDSVAPPPIATATTVPLPSPTSVLANTFSSTVSDSMSISLLPSPTAVPPPPFPSSCEPSTVEALCIFTLAPTSLPNSDWFYPNPNNGSFVCVPLNSSQPPLTCLDYADLNIVPFPDPPTTTQPSTMAPPTTPPRDICNCSTYDDLNECEHCIETECNPLPSFDCSVYEAAGVCSQCFRRRRRNAAMEGEGMSNFNNETDQVLPEGWFFYKNSTDLICSVGASPVSIEIQVYRPCDNVTAGSLSPSNCTKDIVDAFCNFTGAPSPLPMDSYFYPNPLNGSFICIALDDIPTTTAAPPTTVTMTTTHTASPVPNCTSEFSILRMIDVDLNRGSTKCFPVEDPFNPCEDLLGEDDVLRSFIWVVIILAFLGNALVITVFIGYTLILKRTRIELFIIHFFYFNLAIADLLMGIYLFCIAVVDLRTLKNFSAFDVQWRREGGCQFAGFCAITSTTVSVYVLVVITVERLITFSRALRSTRTSKLTGVILMAIGWAFGLLMGILPIVGLSDYTTTAICLPFDVSSGVNQGYVLFLLLFTGLAFTVIAISYVIIFYQVFYRQKTTINTVSDNKRWKIELKVALRMGVLVLTNFVCWFPIALLGISAAVGNSLVNNIIFAKWVMVFIFPINACLNPILYSVLTKVFRDNLVLLLGKCGLCKGSVAQIRRSRAGLTPSVISRSQVSSEAGLLSDRRGTLVERFRNFSITSSTMNLLGRRSSTMSQVSSEERYRIELMSTQKRRSSEFSSASSEDILGVRVSSRRGSAFSGGSIEDTIAFSNPSARSSSPVNGNVSSEGVGVTSNHKVPPRPRMSLRAVLEEEGECKYNPGYVDENESIRDDTSATSATEVRDDVIETPPHISAEYHHHQINSSNSNHDSMSGSDQDSREASVVKDIEQQTNEPSPTTSDENSEPVISRSQEVVSMEFD